jgi:hypothetical protein
MTRIVIAPFAIAVFPLRFHLKAKEPAMTGKERAIITTFQNPTWSRGIVKPMAISSNPEKKASPEPDKKLFRNSSSGRSPFSLSAVCSTQVLISELYYTCSRHSLISFTAWYLQIVIECEHRILFYSYFTHLQPKCSPLRCLAMRG